MNRYKDHILPLSIMSDQELLSLSGYVQLMRSLGVKRPMIYRVRLAGESQD